MDRYKVELSIDSKEDIKDIALYIKNELKEPAIAIKYSKLLRDKIQSLEYHPEKFALIDSDIVKYDDFRKLVVKNYIVFYRVNDDEKIVNVERVLYGASDWKNIL